MTKISYPIIPKISRSKSKAEFYKALGLTEGNEGHDRLYKLMMVRAAVSILILVYAKIHQEEANAGRDRICRNQENLVISKRGVPGPYSASDVTETATHEQVLFIYYAASAATRPWYDRGLYQDGNNLDNWIIRWCLWHAFRYRDSRNQPLAENGRRIRSNSLDTGNPRPAPAPAVVYTVNGKFDSLGNERIKVFFSF